MPQQDVTRMLAFEVPKGADASQAHERSTAAAEPAHGPAGRAEEGGEGEKGAGRERRLSPRGAPAGGPPPSKGAEGEWC